MVKKVYVYVILFATLMMTIGGSVAAFMAIADIVQPSTYQQTFEQYKENQKSMPNGATTPSTQPATQPTLTDAELKKNYDANVAQDKQNARDRAINSLIKSLGWIIIPFPVFLYYQRKLKTLDKA